MTAGRSKVLWRLLVDLGYLALLPLALPWVLWASKCFTRPKFRRGLLSKLWVTPRRTGEAKCFWVHAVSVGEVLTAVPLIRKLEEKYPDWDLRMSVSTFTGMQVARKNLPDLTTFYYPLDFSPIVSRFFRRHRPTAIVLVELELWPNFLLEAARRGVPVLVANARITERSARRYAKGGAVTRRLFNLVTSFGAQNEEYRERLISVGVEPSRIEVLGNLKHDREPSVGIGARDETRRRLGWSPDETLVVTAGSTHPGEERAFVRLYDVLKQREPRLRLVIVPRHVERLHEAELASWGASAPLRRWSLLKEDSAASPGSDILVVDTLGELELFYALADVVFVGGSLIPHGGHNLFEAARIGVPLLFGCHFRNFQEEGDLLLREEGALRVESETDLCAVLERLLGAPEERKRLAAQARRTTERLRGATARHIEWIEAHLRLYLAQGPC